MIKGTQYLNCGDWVENCSALVESRSGEINIINWQAELDPVQEETNDDPLALLAELNGLQSLSA